MPNSYRELKVWQRSIDLVEQVYQLTVGFPSSEIYGLTSQMRRAAVSIPSNLAEGWGRRSRKDYSRFVLLAHGSKDELQTQILIAKRLRFGNPTQLDQAEELCDEIGKMLNGLHKVLQTPHR